jgi:ADP-heptose:LPS heptosyltransferase
VVNDPFFKRIEIGFRRTLIRLLGNLVARENKFTPDIDYNSCKFLFIRQDKIGDVLVSTPLFVALKKHYPNSTIDVLLSSKNHFVLQNDPAIRKRWVYTKKVFAALAMMRTIRKEHYDFAIDLMDNPSATSTVLCLLAGARWNVGIEKENSFVYDITVPMLSRQETHIVDRIAQLLKTFGIDPVKELLAVRYFSSNDSQRFAKEFFQESKLQSLSTIGINISAGGHVRFWGVKNFHDFLLFLNQNYPQYQLLVLYKPEDMALAKEIIDDMQNVVLSPLTKTFDQFAALIQNVKLLISPDTAAIHLASAFQKPALVMYVQSNKSLRIWEPYGVDYETVVTDVDDLSTIPLEQVTAAFDRLIQRTA